VTCMESWLRKGLNLEQRYLSYETVIEKVLEEVRQVKAFCPIHGIGWFGRIGETNRFKCLHADHTGISANGRVVLERPAPQR